MKRPGKIVREASCPAVVASTVQRVKRERERVCVCVPFRLRFLAPYSQHRRHAHHQPPGPGRQRLSGVCAHHLRPAGERRHHVPRVARRPHAQLRRSHPGCDFGLFGLQRAPKPDHAHGQDHRRYRRQHRDGRLAPHADFGSRRRHGRFPQGPDSGLPEESVLGHVGLGRRQRLVQDPGGRLQQRCLGHEQSHRQRGEARHQDPRLSRGRPVPPARRDDCPPRRRLCGRCSALHGMCPDQHQGGQGDQDALDLQHPRHLQGQRPRPADQHLRIHVGRLHDPRTPAFHLRGFGQRPQQPRHLGDAHDHRDVHQGGDPRADHQPRRLRRRQVGAMRWQWLQRVHQLRERIEVRGDQRILFAMPVRVRCGRCTRNCICVRWTSRVDAMRPRLGDNTQRGFVEAVPASESARSRTGVPGTRAIKINCMLSFPRPSGGARKAHP